MEPLPLLPPMVTFAEGGPCEKGETAAKTGCTPAGGDGGGKAARKEPYESKGDWEVPKSYKEQGNEQERVKAAKQKIYDNSFREGWKRAMLNPSASREVGEKEWGKISK
ncbi:uncharacterized protein METZ01_LOCUS336483, partial [marine metagenome]